MKKFQRVFSIILIVMLLSLYIITLVTAVLAKPQAHDFFLFSAAMTIIIPILLYVLLLFSKLSKK